MAEIVRFAPSPTGEMHVGNARTALYNAFLALRTGGTFVLRYDDTDAERSREVFVAQIAADLEWLGIVPGRTVHQSQRLSLYDAAASRLRAAGLLYPCYETAQELQRKRSRQRARGLPPVYDRAALSLSASDRVALEAGGRAPHWRFRLPDGVRSWEDCCRGPQTVNLSAVSDPVLVREDGSYLYTLPSVVDDIDLGVTTVVRGEDHVTNTGVQIALFEALGAAPPAFAHHNLLVRADGEPLSKRDNPLSLRRLSQDGYEPMAAASLAALVGTSRPLAPAADIAALAAAVRLCDVSRAPATFDLADLVRLNAAIVHELPFASVAADIPRCVDDPDAFWHTVRGNLAFRHEVRAWAERLAAPASALVADPAFPQLVDAERAVCAAAADALGDLPWDGEIASRVTALVRERTGARGKALFMPLRKALTGAEAGPELSPWLRLLGRERAIARLEAAAAHTPASASHGS